MKMNAEISADLSTVEQTSHDPTTPDRPLPHGRLARRLAGPGWVIMTLACVYIAVIVSRYLTFDPEVYFAEQGRPTSGTSSPLSCMCSAVCSLC
jgi:hypothetical protein